MTSILSINIKGASLSRILKFEDSIFGIAEFSQLDGEHSIHGAGTASADQSVFTNSGHSLLEHFLSDETSETLPVFISVVNSVVNSDSGVASSSFEFFSHENIFFSLVSEKNSDSRLVLRVVQDGLNDLVHGGNSSSTADQSEMLDLVVLHLFLSLNVGAAETVISQFAKRTSDLDFIANLQGFEILGENTTFGELGVMVLSVNLDEQFKGSSLVDFGDGGVLSSDFFSLREFLGGKGGVDGNMLTNVETQRKIRVGEVVGENVSIVGDFVDLGKGNFHETAFRESLKIALKLFRDLCGVS